MTDAGTGKKAAERIVYREAVTWKWWFAAGFLLPAAAALVVVVVSLAQSRTEITLVAGIVLLLEALLYANFRVLTFEITDSEVRFGFGLMMKSVERDRVLACEPYEVTWENYMGLGVKGGRDGTLGYNTRSGKGVKLTIDGEKRPITVGLDDPEKVISVLSRGSGDPGDTVTAV